MMRNSSGFSSPLIHEFRPGNSIVEPSVLNVYHYTSPEAFLSIIRYKTIRFSDINYMNDRSESVFCVKRMIEFAETNWQHYPRFNAALNFLLKDNDFEKIKNLSIGHVEYAEIPHLPRLKQRNFIFCTSKEPDSLNMWNYYASGGRYLGYNIGLSVLDLVKVFDTKDTGIINAFIIYYGDVIYKAKQQYSAIEEFAIQIENLQSTGNIEKDKHHRAAKIQEYIELRGPFFKSDSFSSENEYRFLFSVAENRIPHNEKDAERFAGSFNKLICEDFCIRNGIIVPFLKITIPSNVIRRITVSPITEFDIAKNSIREVLASSSTNEDKQTVPIYQSRIPIRF